MAGRMWQGVAVAVSVVLVACAADDGRVTWRDLSVEVPDGWVVAEQDERSLSVANADFGPGQADELEAAVFLTHEPAASIDRWRDLVEGLDGQVESDGTVTVGGEPASRLIFRHDANGTPLREMVVVVPSRDVVILFQPVVLRGSAEGAATFDRHRETFDEVLRTLRFEGVGGASPPPDLSTSGQSPKRAVTASVGGPGDRRTA